jgi:hypothetical protein
MASTSKLTARGPSAPFAKALGCSVRSLAEWKRREGFPIDGTPEEVREWLDQNGLGRSYTSAESGDLRELKAESLKRDIALKDQRLAAMRGELVDRDVMRAMLRTLGQKWDLLLRLKLEVELGPRVAGKSAAEANVEGSRILDEIREVVNANLARFEPDVIKQSKSSAGSVEA